VVFSYPHASPLASSTPFIHEIEAVPDCKNINYDEIKAQLLKRLADWVSPYDELDLMHENVVEKSTQEQRVFQSIIELAFQTPHDPDLAKIFPQRLKKVFSRPRLAYSPASRHLGCHTGLTSPRKTPTICRGRIVLLGDAAHTLPPDIGQGASCAVEDAVVYALLLKHYLSSSATTPLSSAPPLYSLSFSEKSSSIQRSSGLVQALTATAGSYQSIQKSRVDCLVKATAA